MYIAILLYDSRLSLLINTGKTLFIPDCELPYTNHAPGFFSLATTY